MDISKAKNVFVETVNKATGTNLDEDVFSDEEKERVSAIGEQLEGLTVNEAKTLLKKISKALDDVVIVQ